MDNQNDIVNEVASTVNGTEAQQVEQTQQVIQQVEQVQTQQVVEMQPITQEQINTIQEDSGTPSKTLNEVAMEKKLESEQSQREKELNDFVSQQLPSGVSNNVTNSADGITINEIPTLDKEMSKEMEEKLKEAKEVDKLVALNRELIKQYKILENRFKDTVDIANERIKLANSVYKEEVEKNVKSLSDPRRVVLDDKMYLLNSLRNDYQADKSEANRQKFAQNLVLILATLYPTINPNDMVNYINNTQKRINNIWENNVSAQPARTVQRPSFSIPRWITKSQRGILG